jgi:plastocyanin
VRLPRALPRLAAAACAAVAVFGMLPGPVANAEDQTIVATNADVFDPATVTIAKGDTVTWSWGTDNPPTKTHTVTATSANWEFDEPLSFTQRSTAFEFTEYGTYTFVCEVHGAEMKGTVRVPAPVKPTVKPTTKPPSPSPTRTTAPPRPRPSATASSSSPAAQPSRSTGTAGTPPLGGVSSSPRPGASRSAVPSPSVAPDPDEGNTVTIGGPGLTPPPATGRGRGVWVMLACVAILGVGSAQLRTLLVLPPDLTEP